MSFTVMATKATAVHKVKDTDNVGQTIRESGRKFLNLQQSSLFGYVQFGFERSLAWVRKLLKKEAELCTGLSVPSISQKTFETGNVSFAGNALYRTESTVIQNVGRN